MDLRQLRYFLAVAKHGSMAAAGRAIHVSQPALGEKIRQLEEQLGQPLFERHSRGVQLSPAGERLRGHAQSILDAVARAEADIRAQPSESLVRLTIGLNPTASRLFAAELLDLFNGPSRISLREAMSHEIEADVTAGRLDAGFCYDPAPRPGRVVAVLREALHLVGPAGRVTTRTDLPFDELRHYSLVLDSGANVLRTTIEEMAQRRGIRLQVAFEVEAVQLKRRLLLRHDQCTVVPFALFSEEIAAGSFNARRIVSPQLRRRLCLVLRPDLPAAHAKLIRDRIRGLVRSEAPLATAPPRKRDRKPAERVRAPGD